MSVDDQFALADRTLRRSVVVATLALVINAANAALLVWSMVR